MNTCSEKRSKGLKSSSGIHLDYTPEDTLKSFVMEKRLTSKMKLDHTDAADGINKCVKSAKLLKYQKNILNTNQQDVCSRASLSSDKSSEQTKRPFLRKNEGRAAWCFRLRPLTGVATPEPASKLPLAPAISRSYNPTNSEAVKDSIDCRNSAKCPMQFTDCDSYNVHESAILSGDEKKCYQTGLQSDTRKGFTVNGDAKVDCIVYDRELEEFEFLERFAEKHTHLRSSNEFELNNLDERLSGSSCKMASARKTASLPALDADDSLMGIQKVFDGGKAKEALDSERLKSSDCKSCLSLLQNPLVMNGNPVKEPSYLDSYDDEQWKNETNVETSMDMDSNRHQPLPNGPKLRDGIALDAGPSLCGNVFDRPPPSAIQMWIARLEAEVNRFNSENTALVKLKMEREETLSALKKEKREFEEYRATTMKEFETFRREEITKLKKERKVLCDYQKSLQSMPLKRDREEIERLKQQICEEKAEAAQREIRLQHQLGRQRMRIEELVAEKAELMERIKRLERARLMLRSSVAEERVNQALKTSNQPHKNSQDRLDFVPQVIGIDSHVETLRDSLRGEMQKAQAASTDKNSERSVTIPLELPHSRSTCGFWSVETIKGSSKSPFACVPPPHSPAIAVTPSDQPRTWTSSDASELCKRENANAYRLCRPLCAPSDRERVPEVNHPGGSVERVHCDGLRPRTYINGTAKELGPDGVSPVLYLSNSDVKGTMEDGAIICNHASDGTAENIIPNGTEETVHRASTNFKSVASQPVVVEESSLPDGMSVQMFSNGDKVISLPNGQRELHCAKFKRRIYPDGTVKTVFKDGRQETHYASGRIRIKDSEGNLLVDTRIAPVSRSAVADLAPLLVPPH
ncbi:Centromere protein J [Taenia crassiceps]|uniref:Centromere protein J n=1 Tax=Taenia crassiceps TaxID=6207 RepID=A0ABR4QQ02_9CEST